MDRGGHARVLDAMGKTWVALSNPKTGIGEGCVPAGMVKIVEGEF